LTTFNYSELGLFPLPVAFAPCLSQLIYRWKNYDAADCQGLYLIIISPDLFSYFQPFSLALSRVGEFKIKLFMGGSQIDDSFVAVADVSATSAQIAANR